MNLSSNFSLLQTLYWTSLSLSFFVILHLFMHNWKRKGVHLDGAPSCVKLIRVLSFTVVALRTYHLSLDHCATTSLLSNPSWWFSSLSLTFFSLSFSLSPSIYLSLLFLSFYHSSFTSSLWSTCLVCHSRPSIVVCVYIYQVTVLSLSLRRGRLTFIWDPSGFFLLLYY